MAFPIKQKIEAVFNGWLAKAAHADLSGYAFYKGQRQDRINVPAVVTAVDSLDVAFPDGEPIAAQVTVSIITKSDFSSANTAATTENAHYAAAAAVAVRMVTAGLADYANADNVTDRPVADFYLYDCQPPRASFLYDDEKCAFITQLGFIVNAQNSNCT